MEQLNKVVLVIDHLWPDGAQRQFVSLVTNLSASGISCTVCSMISGGPLAEALRKEGIPVREGNKKDRSEVFRLIGFVRDVLREEKPQVLQSFLFYSNNLSRIAGRWERVPVIVTSQRCAPYKKFIPFPARIFESLILGFSHTTVVNFLPLGISISPSNILISCGLDILPELIRRFKKRLFKIFCLTNLPYSFFCHFLPNILK